MPHPVTWTRWSRVSQGRYSSWSCFRVPHDRVHPLWEDVWRAYGLRVDAWNDTTYLYLHRMPATRGVDPAWVAATARFLCRYGNANPTLPPPCPLGVRGVKAPFGGDGDVGPVGLPQEETDCSDEDEASSHEEQEPPAPDRDPGQARPKDTDEVIPTDEGSDAGDAHGGDGNSGEVDSTAETSSDEARSGGSPADPGQEPNCDAPAPGTQDAGDAAKDASEPDSAPEPGDAQAEGNGDGDGDGDADGAGQGGGETHPFVPRSSHGGCTAPLAGSRPSAQEQRETKRIKSILEAIVRQDRGLKGDASPKIHAGRLVAEIAAKRVALHKARRQEMEPGVVLFLADVSGSCSASAPACVRACVALADELPMTGVMTHSNGFPVECHSRDAALQKTLQGFVIGARTKGATGEQWAREVAKRHRVSLVVAFGDWDAGDAYSVLAEVADAFVWLDSYAAKSGVRSASQNLRDGAKSWPRQPTGWFQGVNDTASAAVALKDYLRARK